MMAGRPLVIAISGLPGSGKTSLANALARRLAARVLHYDDYETMTARPADEIEAWLARGAPPEEIEVGAFVRALEAALQQQPPAIVLDTPLGRGHEAMKPFIDHSIWIDLPADIALARHLQSHAEVALGSRDNAAPARFAQWLAGFLGNYQAFTHKSYALALDRVRPLADIVIAGDAAIESSVAAIVDALTRPATPAPAEARDRLRNQVAALKAPYGFEQSCKLAPGLINPDRFLLSLHRNALGGDAERRILDILAPVGTPDGLATALREALPGADIVHFGYEGGGEQTVCKLYVEYARRFREEVEAGVSREKPFLVHRAWKWLLSPARRLRATQYMWFPPEPGSLTARLARMTGESHPGVQLLAGVLPTRSIDPESILVLDVTEQGSARHSFDVNLHATDLTLRDLLPSLREVGDAFGLPQSDIARLLEPRAALRVGHISGGYAADGAPFVTVYYGVQGC